MWFPVKKSCHVVQQMWVQPKSLPKWCISIPTVLSGAVYSWLIFTTTIYYGTYDSKVLYLDSFLRLVIFCTGYCFLRSGSPLPYYSSALFINASQLIIKVDLQSSRKERTSLDVWNVCIYGNLKMCENRRCRLPWSRQMTVHVLDRFTYFPAQEEKHPQQQHCTVTRLLPRHKTLLKAYRL